MALGRSYTTYVRISVMIKWHLLDEHLIFILKLECIDILTVPYDYERNKR